MTDPSLRDRFYTRPVARVITAPSTILLAGAAAAVGVVATAPLTLPVSIVIGAVAGITAFGARVGLAIPRRRKEGRDPRTGERIDPFAVGEPWRRFVSDAQATRQRYEAATRGMASGPLKDRLGEIGGRLDEGIDECWRIARRGHLLTEARGRIDADSTRRELAEVEANASAPWAAGSRLEQTAEALRAQVAAVDRMDRVIVDTLDRLRLLDARLDESVTRAIELSVAADDADDLGQLDADVDGLVTEMEALRQALDEVEGRPGPTPARNLSPAPPVARGEDSSGGQPTPGAG